MINSLIPDLPDFKKLLTVLEIERNALIKVDNFSEDDEYLRDIGGAREILSHLEIIQKFLKDIFDKNTFLLPMFDKDFGSFRDFIQRENILEICFIDDCLFPENDTYYFAHEGEIRDDVFDEFLIGFKEWVEEKLKNHLLCQENLSKQSLIEINPHKMNCQCGKCLSDYRNNLRETIYSESKDIIDQSVEDIKVTEFLSIHNVSGIYFRAQKSLDKLIFSIRYKLKRSAINKLEGQIKRYIRELFQYPSDLSKMYLPTLEEFFHSILKKQGLKLDLIEYDRFYRRLATNLWKDERYLERELNKLVKTVLMLKRKDISANILKEYLGEFWAFSQARQINRKIIYHMGPTNSGKTYNAINDLCEVKKGCYLAPLRLLAAELFDTMNAKGVKTTLLTGEECIEVRDATHYSSTIEMARFEEKFDSVVIDEIQMISDSQRGWAWTRALVNIHAKEIHVCGDPSAYDRVCEIVKLCGDEISVKKYERMTKLEVEAAPIRIGDLDKGDALLVFSRRNALKYKADLEKAGFKVSVIYGRLGPEVRREQARKFDHEETDVIVATDAIAMGMNLPIKRIVFSTLSKYINSQEHRINKSEIKQISGRAGRYGRFPIGHVTCLIREENGISEIQEAMIHELPQKEKCMVGPDLEIYQQVNNALHKNSLPLLTLPEFLHLFNNMSFNKPFYCADLKEMIEIAEMVEEIDKQNNLTSAEKFGFSCAPVDSNIVEHVHYFVWILNNYCTSNQIIYEPIDPTSDDIDYLERAIKCVELYQWLSRHFNDKNFSYDIYDLLHNKSKAIEKLNTLLSEKIILLCSSCGKQLEDDSRFAICEICFKSGKFRHNRRNDFKKGNSSNRKKKNSKQSKYSGHRNKKTSSGSKNSRRPSNSSKRTKKKF